MKIKKVTSRENLSSHEIHEQSISCGFFFFFFLHFTSKFMKVVVEMANEAYDDALES